MIRLELEPYCQRCGEFEADVEKGLLYAANIPILASDTVIRCEHRHKCAAIMEYLKKEKENA